jgi:4'-phosphopantetheinyl transferase
MRSPSHPSLGSLALTIELNALGVEVHVWQADLDVLAVPADAVLRRVLAGYLDEDPAAIELRLGEHGKPALAEWPPRLHFNLSHSGMLALIALTRNGEVGVDVEREDVERDFARLAERFLEAEQADALRRVPVEEQKAAFYAAWVRREAVAKCHGTGLGATQPVRPVSVRDLETDSGYAAALALAAAEFPPLRRFAIAS